MFLAPTGHPVVVLTLRHNRLDNFWFTLMHELAHLALHMNSDNTWYLDNLDVPTGIDGIERQADILAKQLSMSPCVVAGRVWYERNDYTFFGRLFRDKVQHV